MENYNLIWTFNAESVDTLQESYRLLAQKLKLVREDESLAHEKILVKVNAWLEAPENHGWLLLFDNADFLKIVPQQNLPKSGGQVLITSRKKNRWVTSIEVLEFEREESIALLKQIIPQEKWYVEKDLNVLAEELGDFPLALDQAGSYLKCDETGLTIAEYLNDFRREHLTIWEEESEILQDKQKQAVDKPYPSTVATTWKITMDHIRENFPDSAKALNLCAYLNADNIPLAWLKEKRQPSSKDSPVQLRKRCNDCIRPLIDFSLLYWEKPQEFFRVHRLVQLVTQDSLSENERGKFIRKALGLVKDTFDSYDYKDTKTWGVGRECLSHAISITNHMFKHYSDFKKLEVSEKEILEKLGILLHQMGTYAWRQGTSFQAKEHYQKTLKIKKIFYGYSHPEVANTLHNLGTAWSDLGEKKKAIEYYEKALEINKVVLGTHHPSVADTLNNLGNAWSNLGEKKKAIEYYTQALVIKKAVFGNSHPEVVDTLNNLGIAWSDLGKKKKAIEFYEKALVMKRTFLGTHHPSVADTLNNLALAWSDVGDNKKSTELYEQALSMYKAFFGERHPSIANTLNNLGETWNKLGENKKAIEYFEKALEIYKAFLGNSHPWVAYALNNLGMAWSKLSKNKKAIEYYEKALEKYPPAVPLLPFAQPLPLVSQSSNLFAS